MKLTVACIGRAGRGPERDLYEHYAGRIRWPLTLREHPRAGGLLRTGLTGTNVMDVRVILVR